MSEGSFKRKQETYFDKGIVLNVSFVILQEFTTVREDFLTCSLCSISYQPVALNCKSFNELVPLKYSCY